MGSQFEPLTVENINQGAFLKAFAEAFSEAQAGLFEHVRKYGVTAEAVVTAKIKIKREIKTGNATKDSDMPHFGIAADVQVNIPKQPVRYSDTFKHVDDSGRECLFAPVGGSTTGNAQQALISDERGQPIAQ